MLHSGQAVGPVLEAYFATLTGNSPGSTDALPAAVSAGGIVDAVLSLVIAFRLSLYLGSLTMMQLKVQRRSCGHRKSLFLLPVV